MPAFRLGVDYGTSHTVAVLAWPDGRSRPLLFDGSPLLPSAVHADTGGRLITGADAVRAGREAPGRTEPNPKRRVDDGEVLLGDHAHPVSALIAAALREVHAEAERVAGEAITAVTLTHPAAWGPRRRTVLADAARTAGLGGAAFLPEPVAAARYFSTRPDSPVPDGGCLLVYDLGAGTCDVTVVRRAGERFEVPAVGGLDDVGGLDLDAVVVAIVGRTAAQSDPVAWSRLSGAEAPRERRLLWTEARWAKESLSRRPSATVHVPLLDREVPVTREEFETEALPLLRRTAATTVRVLADAEVPAGRIAALFLVGGASRVPLAATVLHRETGIAPTVLDQPELVVAEGALLEPGGTRPSTGAVREKPAAVRRKPVAAATSAPPTLRPAVPPENTAGPPPAASPAPVPPPVRADPPRAATGPRAPAAPPFETKAKRRANSVRLAALVIGLLSVAVAVAVSADGGDGADGVIGFWLLGLVFTGMGLYDTMYPRLVLRVDSLGLHVLVGGETVDMRWTSVQEADVRSGYLTVTMPSISKKHAKLISRTATRGKWRGDAAFPVVAVAELSELWPDGDALLAAVEAHRGRPVVRR